MNIRYFDWNFDEFVARLASSITSLHVSTYLRLAGTISFLDISAELARTRGEHATPHIDEVLATTIIQQTNALRPMHTLSCVFVEARCLYSSNLASLTSLDCSVCHIRRSRPLDEWMDCSYPMLQSLRAHMDSDQWPCRYQSIFIWSLRRPGREAVALSSVVAFSPSRTCGHEICTTSAAAKRWCSSCNGSVASPHIRYLLEHAISCSNLASLLPALSWPQILRFECSWLASTEEFACLMRTCPNAQEIKCPNLNTLAQIIAIIAAHCRYPQHPYLAKEPAVAHSARIPKCFQSTSRANISIPTARRVDAE